ncbi:MAG: GNAT family N-acetyltransferase [Pseudonocardia sp.]
MLRALAAPGARLALAGDGRLGFAEGYPSVFVTELLRLVADHVVAAEEPHGLGPWLIVRRSDDLVVGAMNCVSLTEDVAVSVGYEVAGSCRGRGYATEALRLLVEHLLARPGLSRVCAETTVDHLASRRVMEKAGLSWRYDALDRVDGRPVTLAHYAVERPPD